MAPPAKAPAAVEVRSARTADRPPILTLVRRAFTSEGRDGQEEVDILRGTWRSGAAVEGLELVAVTGGRVIGHALAARGDLGGHACLAVAPLCGSPEHHGEGVGSALMAELIRRAEEQGWPIVLVLDEWAYVRTYTSNVQRTQALDHWLHLYNHHRGHTALGGKAPIEVTNLAGQHT